MRLQPIAKDARDGVIRAAGQEADDELDRAGWKFLRGERRQRTADDAEQQDSKSDSAHEPSPWVAQTILGQPEGNQNQRSETSMVSPGRSG